MRGNIRARVNTSYEVVKLDRIKEIKDRWEKYDNLIKSRKTTALNNPQHEKNGWYFALCSNSEVDVDYIFTTFEAMGVTFKNVKLHPMLEELSGVLQDKSQIPRVWSYTSIISYELFIEGEQDDFKYIGGFLAHYLIAALRIVSGVDFIVPMASNYSWSCIPAAQKDSIVIVILEDHPKARVFDRVSNFGRDDFEWTNNNIYHFYHLIIDYPQFRVAVDTLIAYNQHANDRMCVAALWAGIEAVLGIGQELSFRLATYIAAYLEPLGKDRLLLYKKN